MVIISYLVTEWRVDGVRLNSLMLVLVGHEFSSRKRKMLLTAWNIHKGGYMVIRNPKIEAGSITLKNISFQ